jgi:hypothetical protein
MDCGLVLGGSVSLHASPRGPDLGSPTKKTRGDSADTTLERRGGSCRRVRGCGDSLGTGVLQWSCGEEGISSVAGRLVMNEERRSGRLIRVSEKTSLSRARRGGPKIWLVLTEMCLLVCASHQNHDVERSKKQHNETDRRRRDVGF